MEKKPLRKGNPDKDLLATTITDMLTGIVTQPEPNIRISWIFLLEWITEPTERKRSALNIAWVIKWKNDKKGIPILKLNIINLNWLKVDSATIFFTSIQIIALVLAKSKVITLRIWRIKLKSQ